MITVTSAEKNKIEGQMTTALPFMNGQIDFQIEIANGNKGRSRLIFKQGQEAYELPIFYLTPSTDDSAWELLTDHIEDEKDSQGVFFIKFNSGQHVIQNATTYALTNEDLYQKNMLSEMCRLCSYVDLNPYQIQIFDVTDVNQLCERLAGQVVENEEKEEPQTETILADETSKTNTIKVEKAVEEPKTVEESKAVEEPKASAVAKKVETVTAPIGQEEDSSLDSDIKALINDCFGIF